MGIQVGDNTAVAQSPGIYNIDFMVPDRPFNLEPETVTFAEREDLEKKLKVLDHSLNFTRDSDVDAQTPSLRDFKKILEPYLLKYAQVADQNRERAFKEVLTALGRKNKISIYYHVPFAVQYTVNSTGRAFASTPDFFIPELRWQPPRSNKCYSPDKSPMCVVFEPHDYPRKGKEAWRSINRMEAFYKWYSSEIYFVLAGSKSQKRLEEENEGFKVRKVSTDHWVIPNGNTEFRDVKRAVKKRVNSLISSGNCELIREAKYTDDTITNLFGRVLRGKEILNAKVPCKVPVN